MSGVLQSLKGKLEYFFLFTKFYIVWALTPHGSWVIWGERSKNSLPPDTRLQRRLGVGHAGRSRHPV